MAETPIREVSFACDHAKSSCYVCSKCFPRTEIDPHMKINIIYDRLNELEAKLSTLWVNFMPSSTVEKIIEHNINNAHDRVNEIESRIEKLEASNFFKNVEKVICDQALNFEPIHKSIPHKCPVCDGKMRFKNDKLLPGERLNKFQTQDETGVYDICRPCKGKGILWA